MEFIKYKLCTYTAPIDTEIWIPESYIEVESKHMTVQVTRFGNLLHCTGISKCV